jgi:uncharacterized protein YndB with AHSA1/START domain
MDEPFVLEEYYDAPIEKVWQAITDLHALKVWYFPQLRKFQPVAGFEMEFDDDDDAFKKRWCVTQSVDGRKWAHSWAYEGYSGNSEVIFELFSAGDQTRLKLTHTGLASFPNDPHFARPRFEYGWKRIVSDKLKQYLS